MADAKICDRCGKVFKPDGVRGRYSLFDAELSDFAYASEWHGVRVGAMMDLCDKCRDDLRKWAEKSGETEVNNGRAE